MDLYAVRRTARLTMRAIKEADTRDAHGDSSCIVPAAALFKVRELRFQRGFGGSHFACENGRRRDRAFPTHNAIGIDDLSNDAVRRTGVTGSRSERQRFVGNHQVVVTVAGLTGLKLELYQKAINNIDLPLARKSFEIVIW